MKLQQYLNERREQLDDWISGAETVISNERERIERMVEELAQIDTCLAALEAPTQAAPSPELLPVTPATEENSGGPIIDAQTCEPIDPHVSWEPPPPVEAEPDPLVDAGGYAPVTAEDFDTITIVEDPELTQEVIDALEEPVSVLDDPELQAAAQRAQATLVDAELDAELDRVREQERARAKHHFSIFGKLEDA